MKLYLEVYLSVCILFFIRLNSIWSMNLYCLTVFQNLIFLFMLLEAIYSDLGRRLAYHHISIVVDKASRILTIFKVSQSEYFITC